MGSQDQETTGLANSASTPVGDYFSSTWIGPITEIERVVSADIALLRGEAYIDDRVGIIYVPDVKVFEQFANGLDELPDTISMERNDGRRVYLFRIPAGAA